MKWTLAWAMEDPPDLAGGFGAWLHRERRVDMPTVQVDFLREPAGREVVLKRYFFPLWKQRLKGMGQHTWLLGSPKAHREYACLRAMAGRGLPVASPVGCGIGRDGLGFVQDSWLLSLRLPGEDLERRLRRGETPPPEAWFAVGESAGLLHAAGVMHRGLCARNVVLEERSAAAWRAAWVDPSKTMIGQPLEAAARAEELLRFWAPLETLVVADSREAFAAGYGDPTAADPERLWTQVPLAARAAVEERLERERTRAARVWREPLGP